MKPTGQLVIFGPHGRGRHMLTNLERHGFVAVDREALLALDDEELDEHLFSGIRFVVRP